MDQNRTVQFKIAWTETDMERLRALQAYREKDLEIAKISQADIVRFALKYAAEQLHLL